MNSRNPKFYLTIVSLLVFFCITFCGSSLKKEKTLSYDDTRFKKNTAEIFLIENDAWVEETLNNMSLEEKVGQVIFPYTYGKAYNEDGEEFKRLKHLVIDLNVGGFLVFQGNATDQATLLNKLQKISKYPLMISADYERGFSDGISFPYLMAVGAANDEVLTMKMGEIIARESRTIGVHQNYAPVVDINNNAKNPIINIRSFGEDVKLVSRLSSALYRGIQKGRMIATLKHFPGHGNTNTDSHKDIPQINSTKNQLNKLELVPFKSNIKNGVMSVMIGHLGIPVYEKEKNLPSSLSNNIVSSLLRKELNFNGLIITDAMNMKAVTKYYNNSEAAVRAFNAGNDIILFPENDDDAYNGILTAVKTGVININRLNESVRRILLAKRWLGLDKNRFVNVEKIKTELGKSENLEIARKIAQKSITLVKNENNLIPLQIDSTKKYIHIVLMDENYTSSAESFNTEITTKIKNCDSLFLLTKATNKEYLDAITYANNFDFILLSVYSKIKAFKGTIGLSEIQDKFLNSIIDLKKPLVFLSHGNPYLLSTFNNVSTYITNYGDAKVSESALAQAIFGEIDIEGMLPVSIPNTIYRYGHSIKISKSFLENDKEIKISNFENVERIINKAIVDSAFPGASLLVAKDGKIIFEKGFGKLTYDPLSIPVSTNTIFDLASVSKVIATTTATMICVDRKLFSLDDKVSKYIPAFASNGKENITIRNLLLHNSGLPSFKPFYKMYKTQKEVLKDLYNTKLEYETGTKTLYSDLGMITLGKVIEAVTKKTLDKFCNEEIFIPLGMKDTYYNPPSENKYRIAPTEVDTYWRNRLIWGEVHDENSAILGGVAGHAGLFSTVKDLAIILQMILQKGTYKGKAYIQKETVELFTSKQSEQSSRGLGWDTKSLQNCSCGKYFSNLSYGHTGFTGTSVWTDPTRNLIVILLTNRVHPTRENNKLGNLRPVIHNAIIEALEKK